MPGECILLAPGPSMSQALADSFRGQWVGVVSNCFELAPWADFLVAQDMTWWNKHPAAMAFAGRKFSAQPVVGVERIKERTSLNSGCLALSVAVKLGAKRILLYGYDMRGTHFFGQYTNGLRNTSDNDRERHLRQYAAWGLLNPGVEVINCTPGSAIDCFERAECST